MNNFDSLYGNLTTYGRKSGKPHTVEVTYYQNDGKIYLLAHKRNNGNSTDWYHNLEHNPSCMFEVNGQKYNCKAISLKEDKELENTIRHYFEEKGGKEHYDSWYKNSVRIPVVIQIEN